MGVVDNWTALSAVLGAKWLRRLVAERREGATFTAHEEHHLRGVEIEERREMYEPLEVESFQPSELRRKWGIITSKLYQWNTWCLVRALLVISRSNAQFLPSVYYSNSPPICASYP